MEQDKRFSFAFLYILEFALLLDFVVHERCVVVR
jgi:hypothetical protein